ncbi:nitrogen permease regulator 2 [Cladochytrium replicatum]|nr:nitrogen permease regulator 2 [Cladochytrium replicatum]
MNQHFPSIVGIFFAEFDDRQGPVITFEVPEGFVNTHSSSNQRIATSAAHASPHFESATLPDPPMRPSGDGHEPLDFHSISEYIIPKPELCNRLVTISTKNYKIVGFPVLIKDTKRNYTRDQLRFNLCFLFHKDKDTTAYEQVVRKMALALRSLELESSFIHNATTKDSNMLYCMEQLFEYLNRHQECEITINDANRINLKLFPRYSDPPPVYDYQVPVTLINARQIMDKHWDMTVRKIWNHMNGVNSVKRIAELSDVDRELVRLAMQHLLYYGCIKMVDIFQFSNMYGVKKSIRELVDNPDLQLECVKFVARHEKSPPSFAMVFSLYGSLKHGRTVREWMKDHNVGASNIDVRRFIVFGVVKAFVHRLHKYPVSINLLSGLPVDEGIPLDLRKLLDGTHHFDELCTILYCSTAELEAVLSADSSIRYIVK